MNFFEHQHQARQRTYLLVVLYILAVLAIVAATTALISFIMIMNAKHVPMGFQHEFKLLGPRLAPFIALGIGIVSAWRMSTLAGDGAKVALYMGAIPLPLDTKDLKEIQLRNIVEEMSIASGVPAPDIYVLHDPHSINAFAAGTEPSNAVIGVTQGAIQQLSREEMQGVIAHEFSHIFNGDSRLNVTLMGWLAGIMFLATSGRLILEGMGRSRSRSSRNNGAGAIMLLGLGLLLIGYIGVFFARLIQAAVSRQREFLADASAVQFTRNPAGLAGALQKIGLGGSFLNEGATAREASHFFFGSIGRFYFFATHPPIDERLNRLGRINLSATPAVKRASPAGIVGRPSPADMAFAATVMASVSTELQNHLRDSDRAMKLVLAILAADSGNDKILSRVDSDIRAAALNFAPNRRLHILELAVPALKRLATEKQGQLLQAVEMLVVEDRELRPFEIAALALLRRHLDPRTRRGSTTLRERRGDLIAILRMVAQVGHAKDPAAGKSAFASGAALIGLNQQLVDEQWTTNPAPPETLSRALFRLADLVPQEKQKAFEAIWETAFADQMIGKDESVWLRAVSEALEIPIPVTAA